MSKRKVRKKTSFSFFTLYKKNLFVGLGVLAGVFIIYYIGVFVSQNTPIKNKKNITLDSVKIDTLIATKKKPKKVRITQIEILNGCGISNITGQFKPFFKKNDVDIIGVGNWVDFKQHQSFIQYHSLDVKEIAEELAKKLNISIENVRPNISKSTTHELTLVLGFDYAKLKR